MVLHKWNSNARELLDLKNENSEISFNQKEDSTIKTLGMAWKSNEDQFIFKVSVKEQTVYIKRDVLSTIAKLFDPLGLLGPVICKAKIFLQRLWLEKVNWDDPLPEQFASDWYRFVCNLKEIEKIKIDRYILNSQPEGIVLGFSDASTHAYGAVVYLQCHAKDSTLLSKLLASKSRVAPLKTISVPRLELCACLLLAKLVEKVLLSLKMNIEEVILFSDSTIALTWINSPPHQLKTFVGNRVSKIQPLTEHHQWRHISSTENPADIISRGADPTDLKNLNLWWTGPKIFIEETNNDFSSSEIKMDSFEKELYSAEHKQLYTNNLVLSSDSDFITQILSLSNNFQKLIRIISFLFRFLYNCKTKEKKSGSISVEEFQHAKKYLVKTIQVNVFSAEINALKKNESIKRTNVSNLNVFLDDDDLIRVGGRLTNSELSFDQKHPILLPRDQKLTDIIMEHFHIKNLHVGAKTLLHLVRQEYWPLNGRNNARRIVHEFLKCYKAKPKLEEQIMASLPRERVTVSSPFTNTGIDLCGPFYIKYKNQRKGIFNKVYVAIFVCFSTRAVHLEILTDLTSDALIATLKSFFARRGICTTIFSDNATNFVGANSELTKFYQLFKKLPDNLASYLVSQSISWKFLPPRSPNFGGLWEAGVKSFKHHLKRTVGNLKLTIEEFLTVVNQIEGVLNSRPLIPLSSDPNDFLTLTPGHFLIGRPISSIPEPQLVNVPNNRLSSWQKV
ncbi:hypothetical protein AVEN_206044-1 [Araneus ventricosus]|uniref:Integrase catalytic domain-containing protein n=1 Tax=Araneus ventricosus TaxID=182803 RepID=A0A4Y2KEJ5_ARAVE|nr:hypothetical protein AVEN_206044-1 [Araneus ventricosus]